MASAAIARTGRAAPALLALLATSAIVGAGITGCGESTRGGGKVAGTSLTLYTSLPLQGEEERAAESVLRGEKLALKDADAKVAGFTISFVALNDADSETGKWSREMTAANASKAAQDTKTIAYIGELDSNATAVSLPILNEGGILQVAPGGGAVGLTKRIPGAKRGEPDVHYPSGQRHFARVVPPDDVQASAAANWARQLGARRVSVVTDSSTYGAGMGEVFALSARKAGLQVVGNKSLSLERPATDSEIQRVIDPNPDLVYFSGRNAEKAASLLKRVHAGAPKAKLMVPDAVLGKIFYTRLGSAARSTYLTSVTQDEVQLPSTGRKFARAYRKRFHKSPDAHAAYGFAAMQLVLKAIERAGKKGNDRQVVIDEVFKGESFSTAVGKLKIDANGDSDLTRIAGYRIVNSRPVFSKSLQGSARG